MATHDYVIANGTGAAVRADLNNALAAIVSNNSGTSEPATTYAYQWWADTTNNLLKLRNSANNAWITLRELDGTLLMEDGSNSAPGLSFASDTNTGFFSGGADKIGFATGGVERLEIGSSEVVFNDPSNDVDFRVESNGNTHMLFVDAGNDRVGVGQSSPAAPLDVLGNVKFANSSSNFQADFVANNSAILNFTTGTSEGVILRSDKYLRLDTGGSTERARIDSSGRLLVGASNAISGSAANDNLQLINSSGSILSVASSDTTISSGTRIGEIEFWGQPGSTWGKFAGISCFGDASAAANDNPGRLVFYTSADGASSPTERVRISQNGAVGIGTTSNSNRLRIHEGSDTPNVVIVTGADESSEFLALGVGSGNASITAGGVSNTSADLAFRTADNGTESEKARLDKDGRLLVGTTSVLISGAEKKLQMTHAGAGAEIVLGRDDSSVTAGNALGAIKFVGNDGGTYQQGAKIEAIADGTHQNDDKSTRLVFSTTAGGSSSPTERMRIRQNGRVQMAHDGSFYDDGETLSLSASDNGSVQVMRNTNGSFSNSLIFGYVSRTSNSAFQYIKFAANAASDTDFVLRGDGNAYADGSWNGGGADYAEYFEWSDGNTEAEDRRGISVVLDGDKIREAVDGEEPIGVISGNPSVVGDAGWNKWSGKYLRDDYGSYVRDENGHRQLNADFDPDLEYVPREDRPEWDTVGLMGKLRIRKGQVTGARWIKMRDVSDTVEEWLVR